IEQQNIAVTSDDNKAKPSSKLRILVVDDNLDVASSLAMLMEMMGNNVRMAHDGEKAVTVAKEFRPHVVLLDIGLPKLNGYEAARAIRQEPWGKNIFLIAATGWGQEDDKRKSKEAGFDLHMVKPIDPQALMKLLASLPPEYTLAS
ncbi:MAG: response regulator, partial [Methylobacter sp.]